MGSLKILFCASFLCWTGNVIRGQISGVAILGSTFNSLPASVPFLNIGPDARSAGMGDVGAASKPDVNSQHWNLAKYTFIDKRSGLSLTYTPWLKNLNPDIYLLYLTGYYKLDENNTFSGTVTSQYHPQGFAIDGGTLEGLPKNFPEVWHSDIFNRTSLKEECLPPTI